MIRRVKWSIQQKFIDNLYKKLHIVKKPIVGLIMTAHNVISNFSIFRRKKLEGGLVD